MKLRISKNTLKQYPPQVAQKIQEIVSDYPNIKSFDYLQVEPSKTFYVGEGESFTGIGPNGETASFEVVSQDTVGASGVSYQIGQKFKMPAESYLIQTYYYGKYFMTVYKIISLEETFKKVVDNIKESNWELKGKKEGIERIKKLLTDGI